MWGGAPSRRRQALCCCTEFTPEDRPLAGEPLFKTHFGYGPVLRRKGSRVIVYIFGHLFLSCVYLLQPHWAFLAVRRLSLLAARGGLLSLRSSGSVVAMQTWLPSGMGDFPRPGIKPVSPALAGGFLTTGAPRKSPIYLFSQGPQRELNF